MIVVNLDKPELTLTRLYKNKLKYTEIVARYSFTSCINELYVDYHAQYLMHDVMNSVDNSCVSSSIEIKMT